MKLLTIESGAEAEHAGSLLVAPESLRRSALEFSRRHLDCSAAVSYTIERSGHASAVYRSIDVVGSADCRRTFLPYDNRPIPPGAVGMHSWPGRRSWSARCPSPSNHNRFATMQEDYGLSLGAAMASERFAVWRSVYGPPQVSDQLRALLYDGDLFLAWFGCLVDRESTFSPGHQNAANRQVLPKVRELFRIAHSIEQELTDQEGSHLLFDARGRLLSCSERLSPNLDAGLREALGRHAAWLDQGREKGAFFCRGGVRITFTRLDSSQGALYLATLSRSSVLRLSPLYRLAPQCRKVTQRFARGDSMAKLADDLELSQETVRSHLKTAYRKLGVHNRTRLAQLVGSC